MGFSKEQHVILLLLGLTIFCIDLVRPFHPIWSTPLPASANLTARPSPQWMIEVGGTVRMPGIYVFHGPPTGNDALQRAGGPTDRECAPLGDINTLLDTGTRVEVRTSERESNRFIISPMDSRKKFVLGIPIPLNQASAEDLAIVPGISDSLAQRIVEFRESHGPFETWNDLRAVNGVGPKKVQAFRSYLILK